MSVLLNCINRYLEPSIREKKFNYILEILILKQMKKFNGKNNYFSSLSKVIRNCVLNDHIMYMYLTMANKRLFTTII